MSDDTLLEGSDHIAHLLERHDFLEHREHGGLDEVFQDDAFATLLQRLDFHLTAGAGGQRAQVADARNDELLAGTQATSERVGAQHFDVADRQPHTDTAALIDLVAATSELTERSHHALQIGRNRHRDVAHRCRPGFLAHDCHLGLGVERVMSADLATETILQGGDDAAPVGVVLRVRGSDQQHVQRKPNLVAADLHVAFFQDVEQPDLNALGKVGNLVDGENAAIGAWHQAVVQRQLVAEVTALRHLDGVDLTDQVGDGRVGSGELLSEAVIAMHPRHMGGVTEFGHQVAGVPADGMVRVVVDLAARDDGHPLIEQPGE